MDELLLKDRDFIDRLKADPANVAAQLSALTQISDWARVAHRENFDGYLIAAAELLDTRPTQPSGVTEAMIDAALNARVPGGAEVWHWLPTDKGGQKPHQTARNVMRCALEAAMRSAAPTSGLVRDSFDPDGDNDGGELLVLAAPTSEEVERVANAESIRFAAQIVGTGRPKLTRAEGVVLSQRLNRIAAALAEVRGRG